MNKNASLSLFAFLQEGKIISRDTFMKSLMKASDLIQSETKRPSCQT